MKRRDFIRMSTLAVSAGLFGGARLSFAADSHPGPYWLFVEAKGGWDPTSLCDPKGRGLGPNGDINDYAQNEIGQAGNLRYAPVPESFRSGGSNFISGLYSNQQFFDAHFQRLVVINGISYNTNSHQVGQTAAWSGTKTLQYPSLGALISSQTPHDIPTPFISTTSSVSAFTRGVVPTTVMGGANSSAIREIAHGNRVNTSNASRQYHADETLALINLATAQRRQRQIDAQELTRVREAMLAQDQIRGINPATLRVFVDELNSPSAPNAYVSGRGGDADRLFDLGQIAFAGFNSGAAASALIDLGGFDTHDNHESRHYPKLMDYLAAVDNLIEDAAVRGLADNLVIVMTSDFGRTPRLNTAGGKDHWAHGSMMVWAPPGMISGNRVVGATNNGQVSLEIDPVTLAPDPNGIVLTNEYVHQALRSVAGIDQNPEVVSRFPFSEPVLPIFG